MRSVKSRQSRAQPLILVTGASSYLAHRLLPIADQYGDLVGVVNQRVPSDKAGAVESLDLTDISRMRALITELEPDVIIHAAAVNPGGEAAAMVDVNCRVAGCLAMIASEIQSRLVVVSTDVVHNGLDAPYSDSAVATPVNDYGRSKAEGEILVLKNCPDAVVVRTSLIYGIERMDRATAGFAARLAEGQTLSLFHDVLRQPIWVDSLSHALCRLAVEFPDINGTLNVAGDEVISRATYSRKLLDFWKIEVGSRVREVSARDIAGVPLDLRLDCAKAKSLGLALPGFADVVG